MAFIVGNGVQPLQTTAGINGAAPASTTILTTPAGRSAILEGVAVRCTAATAVTIGATAQIEVVAASGDVFASEVMTGVLAAGDVWYFGLNGKTRVIPTSTNVNFNLTVGITGTSQTLTVQPIGHLF